jgi:hypothetical protein
MASPTNDSPHVPPPVQASTALRNGRVHVHGRDQEVMPEVEVLVTHCAIKLDRLFRELDATHEKLRELVLDWIREDFYEP